MAHLTTGYSANLVQEAAVPAQGAERLDGLGGEAHAGLLQHPHPLQHLAFQLRRLHICRRGTSGEAQRQGFVQNNKSPATEVTTSILWRLCLLPTRMLGMADEMKHSNISDTCDYYRNLGDL